MSMLEKMKQVHGIDKTGHMNCAMIDCRVSITDFGKLVKFKRFECFSYSDFHGGLGGLLVDKKYSIMFHFTAHQNFIMIYPVKDRKYNAQSFVDFFEHIKKNY